MTGSPASYVRQADLEAVLVFIAESQALDVDEAYPPGLVARLMDLVPTAHVLYPENDFLARRTPRIVDAAGIQVDDADELYWRVGPCAITSYRTRTRDLTSARLSDVVSWRSYRETPIHRDYFRPGGVDYMLDLGLEVTEARQRTLLFCRERGDRDFTERDRSVLELLRPHLQAREARADLRRSRSGCNNKETGARLEISAEPVEWHLARQYEKFRAKVEWK